MITITLESLSSGKLRATGRHNGATVAYRDGTDAKEILAAVMQESAGHHRKGDGTYDLTHISLNAAASAALA